METFFSKRGIVSVEMLVSWPCDKTEMQSGCKCEVTLFTIIGSERHVFLFFFLTGSPKSETFIGTVDTIPARKVEDHRTTPRKTNIVCTQMCEI